MRKKEFKNLSIKNSKDLMFGKAPNPVTCGNGLIIGGGNVFPEINFTLPVMPVSEENWSEVIEQYREIAKDITSRAAKLKLPGLVVEFEQLPPMTENPQWGAEITALLQQQLKQLHETAGIATALRVTVVDLRDTDRPPILRSGKYWELTRESFVCSAQAGADILSIESVGGKEVHDQALVYGDLLGIIVSLGSLGWRDMSFLWNEISQIADEYKVIAGGDTACGFSNTAMQLAGKGMIPGVLAALDRAASAPRSLAAYEHGAVGPSKDCAYEGPIIKAITGYPISMEGKSSSCAHFSPLGNISAAASDLWSNESVQNIRLLSGSAPEAFLELLTYDCRLFNQALHSNTEHQLQKMLVDSDVPLSVEALMLDPEVVINMAQSIVDAEDGYNRTVSAVATAIAAIHEAIDSNRIELSDIERQWLGNLEDSFKNLPESEEEALSLTGQMYGQFFLPEAYSLK